MDTVAITALIISTASLAWTVYSLARARETSRKSAIEIKENGRSIRIEVRDLEKPEQAELFVKDILSRQDGDEADAK